MKIPIEFDQICLKLWTPPALTGSGWTTRPLSRPLVLRKEDRQTQTIRIPVSVTFDKFLSRRFLDLDLPDVLSSNFGTGGPPETHFSLNWRKNHFLQLQFNKHSPQTARSAVKRDGKLRRQILSILKSWMWRIFLKFKSFEIRAICCKYCPAKIFKDLLCLWKMETQVVFFVSGGHSWRKNWKLLKMKNEKNYLGFHFS